MVQPSQWTSVIRREGRRLLTIVLVIVLIAALVAVMKYAKFLWRMIGLFIAILLVWLYKENIMTWFSQSVAGDGLMDFLTGLGTGIKNILDKIFFGLGDLL